MVTPQTLLFLLAGGAIGAGGILQGLQWRTAGRPGGTVALEEQLRLVTEENEILRRENESLRSLAQGGGEVAVPQDLVDRVEREYGLEFKSTPVVHRIGAEELKDRISASYESSFGPGGLDYRQEAYGLIGWLMPGEKLLTQLTAVRAVGAKAWFDPETGEGWVIDRFQMENVPDQAAMLRIVVRILLHQNFPPPEDYPGDDAARAREALHQGAASASEAKYYAEQARVSGFMPMVDQSETEYLLNSLSPFIQELTMFAPTHGGSYVGALKAAGPEKLLEAFRDPPRMTRQILNPGLEEEERPELAMPVEELEPFMSDRGGELGLRLWLEPMGDAGVALELSSAWKNDRYVFFPDGEVNSAVMWDVVFTTEEAADDFLSAGLDYVAGLSGKDDAPPQGEVVETLEKRFVSLARVAPDRVRFVNAAERGTAENLKAK